MGLLGTLVGHGLNGMSSHLNNNGHRTASGVIDGAIRGHNSRWVRECVQDRRFERSRAHVKVQVMFQRND